MMDQTKEYYSAIINAESVDQAWSILVGRMKYYKFDRLLYAMNMFSISGRVFDLSDTIILSNYPKEYLDKFLGDQLYVDGPMINWARANKGAMSWGVLDENRNQTILSDKQKMVYDFNQRMGIKAGYTVGFSQTTHRRYAGIGCCAQEGLTQDDVDILWNLHGDNIMLDVNLFHTKLQTLPLAGGRPPLTERQKEILQWAGDGKTVKEIGLILDLKETTVEKHLSTIRDLLGVSTTTQAILKSALLNQLYSPIEGAA